MKSFDFKPINLTDDNWCDECSDFRERNMLSPAHWKTCTNHKLCLNYQHEAHSETRSDEEVSEINEDLLIPKNRERFQRLLQHKDKRLDWYE